MFHIFKQGYIFWLSPPPREMFVQIENGEEFEGGLNEKRKGKGWKRRKKKRVIKYTLKYLYEA